jgi:hypothetical protein
LGLNSFTQNLQIKDPESAATIEHSQAEQSVPTGASKPIPGYETILWVKGYLGD